MPDLEETIARNQGEIEARQELAHVYHLIRLYFDGQGTPQDVRNDAEGELKTLAARRTE